MNLICCLDTNAMLDICYRYYARTSFDNLWVALEDAVLAGQIDFIQSEHIHSEIQMKIHQFKHDKNVYDGFLKMLKVNVIKIGAYGQTLTDLKGELKTDIPFISKKQSADTFLSNLDEDLSNVAVALVCDAKVITSEQGFNKDLTNPELSKRTPIKIPDVCHYKDVRCSNWLEVFEHLGLKF